MSSDAQNMESIQYKCPNCNLIQGNGKCYKCGSELVPANRKIVTLEFDNGKKEK